MGEEIILIFSLGIIGMFVYCYWAYHHCSRCRHFKKWTITQRCEECKWNIHKQCCGPKNNFESKRLTK